MPPKRNAALDAIMGEVPAEAREDTAPAPVTTAVAPPKPVRKYAKVMLYTHPDRFV